MQRADVEFTIDFNDERMGSGIGREWSQTAGRADAVAVAAFPTAVDRSALLLVREAGLVETCRSFEPSMSAVTRLSVEFLLSTVTTTAVISVGVAPGQPGMIVSLGGAGTAMTEAGGRVVAEGKGLDPGAWYRAEVVVDGMTMLWRIIERGDPPDPVVKETAEIHALEAVGEVCLAVSGESQDAVHFDNLTIVTK